MAPTAFVVADAEAGLRLDVLLFQRGLFPSAAAARRALAQRSARIDGQPARKGDRLRAGQRIELATEAAAPAPAAAVALVVLYLDEDLVALAKPAGVPSHPLRAGEGGTLAEALAARFPECAAVGGEVREAGLVHRLDTGTSGVLLAARTPAAYTSLRAAMAGGGSRKDYLAEVAAVLDGDAPLSVDVPIGRRGRRGSAVVLGAGRGLLEARTEVIVRQRRPGTTLVEARLARGRPHQVRAHLAHIGAPIVGDVLYGGPALPDDPRGFRLHAWRIHFTHPRTGAPLCLEAPPPPWAMAA